MWKKLRGVIISLQANKIPQTLLSDMRAQSTHTMWVCKTLAPDYNFLLVNLVHNLAKYKLFRPCISLSREARAYDGGGEGDGLTVEIVLTARHLNFFAVNPEHPPSRFPHVGGAIDVQDGVCLRVWNRVEVQTVSRVETHLGVSKKSIV